MYITIYIYEYLSTYFDLTVPRNSVHGRDELLQYRGAQHAVAEEGVREPPSGGRDCSLPLHIP